MARPYVGAADRGACREQPEMHSDYCQIVIAPADPAEEELNE